MYCRYKNTVDLRPVSCVFEAWVRNFGRSHQSFSGFDLCIEAQSCCRWSRGHVPASAWIMGICHQVPPKSASFPHPQTVLSWDRVSLGVLLACTLVCSPWTHRHLSAFASQSLISRHLAPNSANQLLKERGSYTFLECGYLSNLPHLFLMVMSETQIEQFVS